MPSFGTLKADTLTHSNAGSVDTTYPISGSAKVYLNFNGSSNAIRDSLNVASVTDVSTGIYQTNFTSSFSSADYGHSHTNITNVAFLGLTVDNDYVQSAGSIKQRNADWTGTSSDNASTNDSLYFHIQEFGDLA